MLPEVSRREAGRFQGLLRTNAINTLVLAELARTVDESLFHDEDKESLLKAIANTSTEAAAPPDTPEPSRTKSQNWSCVIHKLLPEIVWKSLVDERCEQMFEHLGRLGLRLPDERTFRSMAIAFLWASNGAAKFASVSPCTRLSTVKAMKSLWAVSYISKLPKPECWIQTAPADIDTFKSQFPSQWNAAFGDSSPAPQPMTDIDWNISETMTKCRSSKIATPMQRTFEVMPDVQHQTMNALAGITQLLARLTNAEPQQSPASSPTAGIPITFLGGIAKKQPSGEILAPKVDALDHQNVRVILHKQDGAADEQASSGLPLKDDDGMTEVADALAAKLSPNKSSARPQKSFKRPASSHSTLKNKKTVAAPDDVPKGWTQVTPTPDDVPEGWTAWAMPRGDKIYIDASGKRYRSMKEVEKAIR